ncbi:MAG: hypothetical protein IJK97_02275 [Thermoguttaceae bacterium]|nr:hypothetical protein [Thermoguttaceae bacterium]
MTKSRIDFWAKKATQGGVKLVYKNSQGGGNEVPLLEQPSAKEWDEWTVALSMREVEPGVRLIMDKTQRSVADEEPDWVFPPQDNGGND